jgi:hypothetical protein
MNCGLQIGDFGLNGRLRRDRPACGCHPAPARAGCTNKPNWPPTGQAGGTVAEADRAKQSQFPVPGGTEPAGRGVIRRNKPNLPRRARERARLAGDGEMRKTNPICRRRAGKTIVKARGLGNATLQTGNCVKQTQSGGSAGAPEGEICKTNPILRLRIWDCGFRKACGPPPGLAGPAVQTKPIGWSQSCDNASLPGVVPATDPIRPGLGRAGFRADERCETNPILRGRAEAMEVESATIYAGHTLR